MTERWRWSWWAGFLVVGATALYLTYRAYHWGLPKFFELNNADKVAHFVIAGLLAFFLDGALRSRPAFAVRGRAIPWAAVIVLVPTAIEEFLQRFSETRTSSIWDYSADVVGVVALIPLSRWLRSSRAASG